MADSILAGSDRYGGNMQEQSESAEIQGIYVARLTLSAHINPHQFHITTNKQPQTNKKIVVATSYTHHTWKQD
jgi:hypothetical protein